MTRRNRGQNELKWKKKKGKKKSNRSDQVQSHGGHLPREYGLLTVTWVTQKVQRVTPSVSFYQAGFVHVPGG